MRNFLPVGLIVSALILSGCAQNVRSDPEAASADSGLRIATEEHEPPLGRVLSADEIAKNAEFKLPLDAYVPSAADEAVLRTAERRLEVDCLREFGFEPEEITYSEVPRRNGRRYGINASVDVERLGYHPDPKIDNDLREKRAKASDPSEAEHQVSIGEVSEYNGLKVPKDGCLGKARRHLYGNDYTLEKNLSDMSVQRLELEASVKAEKDPRVRAVFERWSKCMVDRGYEYGDPWAANDDRQWQQSPASSKEIKAAKADLSCRRKYEVTGVWHAVDTAYQEELIERNGPFLRGELERNREAMRKANNILGR